MAGTCAEERGYKMSTDHLTPIELLKLAVELKDYLYKRIAELEAENNRLRAETTRTIIPESAYKELSEDYAEMESDYNGLCKENIKLRKEYDELKKDFEIISNYNIELLKKCPPQ